MASTSNPKPVIDPWVGGETGDKNIEAYIESDYEPSPVPGTNKIITSNVIIKNAYGSPIRQIVSITSTDSGITEVHKFDIRVPETDKIRVVKEYKPRFSDSYDHSAIPCRNETNRYECCFNNYLVVESDNPLAGMKGVVIEGVESDICTYGHTKPQICPFLLTYKHCKHGSECEFHHPDFMDYQKKQPQLLSPSVLMRSAKNEIMIA
jgi:hypothetical protein